MIALILRQAVLLSGLFGWFASLQASVVIDIGKMSEKALRVVAFHSGRQQMLHYETMAYEPFSRPLHSFLSQYTTKGPTEPMFDYALILAEDGCLSLVPSSIKSSGHVEHVIVTTSLPTHAGDVFASCYSQSYKKHCWFSEPIKEKSPEVIIKLVAKRKDKGTRLPEFPLTIHDQPKKLCFLQELSNGKKGYIGELITQMTMMSFGYDFQPSIYSGNKGIDGVFLSYSREFLVLAQSKLGNANPLAYTVIDNELSEPNIAKRLALMDVYGDEDVKASRALVMLFMQDHPERIYKMAQCVFNCGFADLRMRLLNVQDFPKGSAPMYGARPQEKIDAVRATLSTFEASAVDQLKLALQSIPLEQIPRGAFMRVMLDAMGVPVNEQPAAANLLCSGEDTE